MAKNQGASRMVFENAKSLAQTLGYDLRQSVCTQSYIRSEVAMSTSTASYHLPILVNDTQNGSTRVNENRLNLQDVFFCSEIFIGWTVATATAVNGKVYTYPSITGAGATATATALQTLYNGKMSIQVNNQNILPGWDVNRHFFAPRTQENTNFTAASLSGSSQYAIDQVDLSEDAFVAVEPSWVLNGASNINATIQLPGAISAIPTNGAIVAIFRGILLQNVSSVK